jgi:hypothetical protein
MADHHDHAHGEAADAPVLPEPEKGDVWGTMGLFETPAELYHACEELRDAGYKSVDAMTPFPVHGLEKALGLEPSKLPWFVLVGGAVGLSSGIALTWYVNFDYPLNISGKVPFSYHVYIPVYFELTILLSALTCFFTLWVLCKVPTFFHPTMRHKSFPRSSDDGFFVTIEATDPKYDSDEVKALLEKLGAKEVEEVAS